MHEMLSFAVYRRVGQIAPREAFAKVYINNEYQGVYAVVEPINEPFLQRVFGSAEGYLSEYHWIRTVVPSRRLATT
jgi:spore coat protein CotH